jgi:hypothetical protein
VRAPAGSRAHRLAAYPQCCADAFGIQRDRMNRDRKTGEPVVLELRSGNAAWAHTLDWTGWGFAGAASEYLPWRSLGITLVATWLAATVLPQSAYVVVATVGAAASCVEWWRRRDYLTTSRLVRQSGLLGLRRQEFPLEEVEALHVHQSRRGQTFDAGDIEVKGPKRTWVFPGVDQPHEKAERIRSTRDRWLEESRRRTTSG